MDRQIAPFGRLGNEPLIDYFTLALTHGLLAIALWRILWRDDLDRDRGTGPVVRRPWVRDEAGEAEKGG